MKTSHPILILKNILSSVIVPRRPARSRFALALALITSVFAGAALQVQASDPVGVYAYVDRVVLEPNDTSPERIQVWGGFALADGRGDRYTTAQKGYLYYTAKPGKETLTRNEWSDLKSVAGTGQIVGLGLRYASNGVVRLPDAKVEKPDVYPLGMGLQKISSRDYKPINELKALQAKDKKEK